MTNVWLFSVNCRHTYRIRRQNAVQLFVFIFRLSALRLAFSWRSQHCDSEAARFQGPSVKGVTWPLDSEVTLWHLAGAHEHNAACRSIHHYVEVSDSRAEGGSDQRFSLGFRKHLTPTLTCIAPALPFSRVCVSVWRLITAAHPVGVWSSASPGTELPPDVSDIHQVVWRQEDVGNFPWSIVPSLFPGL